MKVTRQTVGSLLLALAWFALLYFSLNAALCIAALAIFAHGIVGAIRRKIVVRGRFGPPKEYVGQAAIREGLFIAFFSLAFGAFAILSIWLLPLWAR